MATYYSQRAGAGLIVTEGTQPSVIGQGHPNTPGLHSDEQVAEEVVPAVRENVARHRTINGGGTDSGSDQAEDIAL
jgi:2,4-dienoyl-CoA reductase-like NADH-dependent reductase (Old Yellow Enzyme family)